MWWEVGFAVGFCFAVDLILAERMVGLMRDARWRTRITREENGIRRDMRRSRGIEGKRGIESIEL
jgi:hypothetical protein